MTRNDPMPDTEGQRGPHSHLDIYSKAVDSTVDDEFLQENKLGLGNYSDAEHWQQVESFQQGMFADAAFSRKLTERAINEAKRHLSSNGWQWYDERRDEPRQIKAWDDLDEDDRSSYDDPLDRADSLWRTLSPETQLSLVGEVSGFRSFTPPQWRLMQMRHESSRSRDARLLDNLFERVREFKGDEKAAEKGRLLRRRRNRGDGR